MPSLQTEPRFHDSAARTPPLQAYTPGDVFYERLIAAHRGLDDEGSRLLNARLVLLLANQVGDLAVLDDALAAARRGLAPSRPPA